MRHKVRVIALQVLFQRDLRNISVREVLKYFKIPEGWDQQDNHRMPPDSQDRPVIRKEQQQDDRAFFLQLIRGVEEHREEIDRVISSFNVEWPLFRMPTVDRNILRLAVFEILYVPEISVGVTINEAVELAKKYSTEDSGKFVNGVLGKLVRTRESDKVTMLFPGTGRAMKTNG
ncbi:MAG: transcription antitermination factor NusB [Candidatus Atribacteria bacterium]|nr:transcription antitermination factor NusB [Candidatus Atribacteria bacterium]